MRTASTLCTAWLIGLLAACSGGGDTASSITTATTESAKSLGLVELTISGLGTEHPDAAIVWNGQTSDGSISAKSTALPSALLQGLDVATLSSSSIDSGARGAGGTRFISATFKVRNAPSCSPAGSCAAYNFSRKNLTFLAVNTPSGINGSGINKFLKFDLSNANPALALQLLPTHGMNSTATGVETARASLQAYRETELPAPDPGVNYVFPYGFVVNNVNDGSRTIAATPAVNQFDGLVTFAFKIPLQPSAADDPFKISLQFQTIEDANTRVTQSIEEQTPQGDLAANARASAIASKDLVTLGTQSGRIVQTPIGDPICSVRIAGPSAAPTAYLVNTTAAASQTLAAPINLTNVPLDNDVSLGFCETMAAPTSATFFVHGSQSGFRKVGAAYGGSPGGGNSSNRPNQLLWDISGQKPFFRGETVTFTATAGNTNGTTPIAPIVGSFRTVGTTGNFAGFAAPTNSTAGSTPFSVSVGDLNGDGKLDVVLVNANSDNISVFIGNGAGGLAAATNFTVGSSPISVALGDVNGDGKLDIVTANSGGSNNVTVLIGDGAGNFSVTSSPAAGTNPESVALGDVDGDGRLDIVVANQQSNNVSVLIGNGNGTFQAAANKATGTGPRSVALGDVNGDGKLDIVTGNASNSASVLIGNGAGGFAAATTFTAGLNARSVTLGDVNGDGKLDIVEASGTNTVSVAIGNGAGGFSAVTNFVTGTNPVAATLGDVNGDGKLDIVTANYSTSNISLLIGNGIGGFSAATNFPAGPFPNWMTLGDLNGDGKLDIVSVGGTSNVSVLSSQ